LKVDNARTGAVLLAPQFRAATEHIRFVKYPCDTAERHVIRFRVEYVQNGPPYNNFGFGKGN